MSQKVPDAENYPKEISNGNSWYENDSEELLTEDTPIYEYDITAAPNDFNIKTIFDFIESGVVKIPGFQRNYVWDKKRASKLIESIIIGLPIPQIFLYEEAKNKFLVIDGQQRLMSIYYFIKLRFPRKEKRGILRTIFDQHGGIPQDVLDNDVYFEKFNLQLPERLPNEPNKFNKLNYSTLGEYKTTFDLRVIRNIIIKQNFPKDDDSSIYEIFNRLNTGGINLQPHEIRTSIYHSGFYDMLYRINILEKWRKILGIEDTDLHMKDLEFLLRGFAMLIDGDKYKPSMTKFLNTFSKNCKRLSPEDIAYLEELFKSFLASCAELPDDAFHSKNRKFSIFIFDAAFSAVCEQPYKQKKLVKTILVSSKIEELKADIQFSEASQSETASANNVETRRSRARTILMHG